MERERALNLAPKGTACCAEGVRQPAYWTGVSASGRCAVSENTRLVAPTRCNPDSHWLPSLRESTRTAAYFRHDRWASSGPHCGSGAVWCLGGPMRLNTYCASPIRVIHDRLTPGARRGNFEPETHHLAVLHPDRVGHRGEQTSSGRCCSSGRWIQFSAMCFSERRLTCRTS